MMITQNSYIAWFQLQFNVKCQLPFPCIRPTGNYKSTKPTKNG